MQGNRRNPLYGAALCVLVLGGCSADHTQVTDDDDDIGSTATRGNLAFVPDYPGAGNSGADEPLVGGLICDSAPRAGAKAVKPTTECFFGPGQTTPVATIEQVLECAEGVDGVHLRLTFDPAFVDNSYGDGAIGWDERQGPGGPGGAAPPPPGAAPAPGAAPGGATPAPLPPGMKPGKDPKPGMAKGGPGKGGPGKGGHSWKDLVGSDHAELVVTNEAGEVVSQFKLDYVSQSASAPSGYASLGVLGGDGRMIIGDPSDIVRWRTSVERNLNERGYGSYLESSPATDASYTANDETPGWDYRVVYEVWIDIDAFGASGFGGALIEHVHASPSKASSNTITVTPGPCPCERDGGCGDGPPPPPPEETCDDEPEDPACALE